MAAESEKSLKQYASGISLFWLQVYPPWNNNNVFMDDFNSNVNNQ